MSSEGFTLPLHTGEYYSQALRRLQPYACYLPRHRETGTEATQQYPLLVMLHGLNGNYLDWANHTRIARYLAPYRLIVVFPEGGDGWYTNAVQEGERCEDDLIQDFLPYLQRTLPLMPSGKGWGIGGLSMGGYGAVKLALKYPALFSIAISHSGALEKPNISTPHPVFGDPQADQTLRRHENPFWLVEQALCGFPASRPRLHLDCGLNDGLLEANRRFSDHLTFLGYPHSYQEMPGYHTWPYWDRAFRRILPTIAKELGCER
jgi:putative tributyrin esterase